MWLSLNQDGRELNEHTSSPPQNPFEKDKWKNKSKCKRTLGIWNNEGFPGRYKADGNTLMSRSSHAMIILTRKALTLG